MSTLHGSILIVWALFWVYWLISAAGAKPGARKRRARPAGLLIIGGVLLLRALKAQGLVLSSPVVLGLGTALFLAGLGLAVWARVHLGANWGMPMTQKQEPELVTSGPYRLVRHPIYTGILLAILGTALVVNVYWLAIGGLMGAYFIYSATVEERILTDSFPDAYPSYRAKTKMLIPFVL